jgi:hypothetical protein
MESRILGKWAGNGQNFTSAHLGNRSADRVRVWTHLQVWTPRVRKLCFFGHFGHFSDTPRFHPFFHHDTSLNCFLPLLTTPDSVRTLSDTQNVPTGLLWLHVTLPHIPSVFLHKTQTTLFLGHFRTLFGHSDTFRLFPAFFNTNPFKPSINGFSTIFQNILMPGRFFEAHHQTPPRRTLRVAHQAARVHRRCNRSVGRPRPISNRFSSDLARSATIAYEAHFRPAPPSFGAP